MGRERQSELRNTELPELFESSSLKEDGIIDEKNKDQNLLAEKEVENMGLRRKYERRKEYEAMEILDTVRTRSLMYFVSVCSIVNATLAFCERRHQN